MVMTFDLSSLHAHLNKPFAVKFDELLPCMMLLGKRYIAVSAEDQHRHSATQTVADDYDAILVMPGSELPESAELATHGASTIGFLFT